MARVSGSGLLRAAANVLRGGVLLGVLLTLVLARAGVPALLLVVAVAISLGALYAVDRGSGGFAWFAAYLVGFVVFALLRTMADETGVAVKADYVVDAERRLFGGGLPTAWLQERLYEPSSAGVLAVACILVYATYYIVPHAAALVLWRRSPSAFAPYALAVLITVYIGLAVSFVAPTAPPWLAADYGDGPPMARVIADVLDWNPEQAGGSGAAGANPFAAMPSLHFAVTVIVAVALWRRRSLRALALAYVAAMGFGLVYLGEHYVVDELAGVATAAVGLFAASRVLRRRVAGGPGVAVPEPASRGA
jgi:hypothetical protein